MNKAQPHRMPIRSSSGGSRAIRKLESAQGSRNCVAESLPILALNAHLEWQPFPASGDWFILWFADLSGQSLPVIRAG
jgi:hypothetical protein